MRRSGRTDRIEKKSFAFHRRVRQGYLALARARPDLEPRITRRLLALDKSHHEPGRRDLVKSYALEAFDTYFDRSTRRASILSFARAMSTSKSPRAARAARAFLKAHAPG